MNSGSDLRIFPERFLASSHPETPSPLGDCVVMKRKSRHSRESGNPAAIFIQDLSPWMPAYAGMTNYDTVSCGRGLG